MRKRISLPAAAACLVAVALGLAAAPAHAADPVFTLTGPARVGLRPHPGQGGEAQKTSIDFRVDNATGTVFQKQSTFTIDLRGLKGIADVALSREQGASCTLAAETVTCKKSSLWTQDSGIVALDLSAAKGSTVGTTVDLTMTGTADGAAFTAATTTVEVGGPDLVLEDAHLRREMVPGGTQPLPIVFSNAGTTSVHGVALELNTTHGIGLVETYDNCVRTEDDAPGQAGKTGWGRTVCTLEGEFEPGAVYEVSGALTLKAAPHAFLDSMTYAVREAGARSKVPQRAEKPATGRRLESKERPAAKAGLRSAPSAPVPASAAPTVDLDPGNNHREFDFRVENTADLVAAPVSVKGAAGETVRAELGFRNDGPAWIAYLRSGEEVAVTDIVVPTGAKVTKAPAECRGVTAEGAHREEGPGAPRYFCSTPHIVGEKQKFSYPFELKIEKVVADATGSVSVGGRAADGTKPQDWDPNRANNKAAFVINAKGGGTTPNPSPSPSASTGTGAPAPGASASPSASVSAAPSAGAAPHGGLASTGSAVGPLAVGAAALVAAGGALVLGFRRRAAGRGARGTA
ncbi:peptidase [Streptomyces sp. NPDC091268]|uniref:peptidase n=1 Tax=Streptomyces sp. NPDC091268 TaxID=3365979 RepID=UPI0037F8FE51